MIIAAFAFVAVVAIAEAVLSSKWNRAYFTTGLPIFVSRVDRTEPLETVPLEQLANGSATAAGPALHFERLDTDTIAFREKAGGLPHYVPLMRGVIRRDPAASSATLLGLMNWFVIALVIALIVILRRNIVYIWPVPAAFAILYLIQGVRFWRVPRALRPAPALP